MDRIADEGATSDAAAADSWSAKGPDYDLAGSPPLNQSWTALSGEDLPPAALPAFENRVEPDPSNRLGSAEVGRERGFRPGAIVLLVGAATLAGAGLMWLAVGATDRIPAPPRPPVPVAPAATAEPAATAPVARAPVALPQVPADEDQARARNRIERWRQAWESRDIEAYLASYSADFVPAGGQTRSNWANARRKNLSARSEISVRVHNMRIERIDANHLKAVFLQDYVSGKYREDAQPKILLLVRSGSDWQIGEELQGTRPASAPSRK